MNSIMRRIDDLGRVTLPIEFRAELGMSHRSPVNISMVGRSIVIEQPGCSACGSETDLIEWRNLRICAQCLAGLMKEAPSENHPKS